MMYSQMQSRCSLKYTKLMRLTFWALEPIDASTFHDDRDSRGASSGASRPQRGNMRGELISNLNLQLKKINDQLHFNVLVKKIDYQ